MIADSFDRLSTYFPLGGNVGKALEFLAFHPLDSLSEGKTVLSSGDVFLLVQRREACFSSEEPFEAHRLYVDIHITLEGDEWLGYSPVKNLTPLSPYDPREDCETFSGDGVFFQGGPDRFFLFFPWDGHKACISRGKGGEIRKIVVKAAIGAR